MKKEKKANFLEEYKVAGQIPMLWQISARKMICAANILRIQCANSDIFSDSNTNGNNLWKPYNAVRLLYGLALENMLKGLLVAQGVDATSTGRLNKALKNHDLNRLWSMAHLPLDKQSEKILDILRWSIDTGKYPVGTGPESGAPSAFAIAIVSDNLVMELLEIVEDALRMVQKDYVFEKTDLTRLCCG